MCLNKKGLPNVPLPIITESHWVSDIIDIASSGVLISPLPITQILTASLTAFIIFRSAKPLYACFFVLAWTVIALMPQSSAILAISTALMLSSSQPERIFTLTGREVAFTTAFIIAPESSGIFISAEPSPFFIILVAGHPILISMAYTPRFSRNVAASAIISGSLPKSWIISGCS